MPREADFFGPRALTRIHLSTYIQEEETMSEHERMATIDEARTKAWIRLLDDPETTLVFDADHGARIDIVHAGAPIKRVTLDYPR